MREQMGCRSIFERMKINRTRKIYGRQNRFDFFRIRMENVQCQQRTAFVLECTRGMRRMSPLNEGGGCSCQGKASVRWYRYLPGQCASCHRFVQPMSPGAPASGEPVDQGRTSEVGPGVWLMGPRQSLPGRARGQGEAACCGCPCVDGRRPVEGRHLASQ